MTSITRRSSTRSRHGWRASRVTPGMLTIAVNNLGIARGSTAASNERALELFEEALEINREGHDRYFVALALSNLGSTTLELGDVERARDLLRDGLAAAREIGQVDLFIHGFAALGVGVRTRGSGTRRAPAGPRGRAARGNGVPRRRPVRAACSRRDGSRVTGKAGGARLRSGVRRRARARARRRADACPPARLSGSRLRFRSLD